MNSADFEDLCRQASLALELPDTSAMALGVPVLIDEVWIELVFDQRRPGLAIFAELGEVEEEQRIAVYESLLSLQLMTWDQPAVRFGLNLARRTPVFCASASLKPDSDGLWLAAILKQISTQVREWRNTLLLGKLMPFEDDDLDEPDDIQSPTEMLA